MSRLTLGAAALALTLGLAPLAASAQDYASYMPMFDRNKDGLVSKKEFLNEMGKRYDATMAKAKAMPQDEQARMIRNNQFTADLIATLMRDLMQR